MTIADLTPRMVIIVVIGVFIGSFVDGIAGGGGLITLPTFMMTGLPMHFALGTNKLAVFWGTCLSATRYIRKGLVNWRLTLPSVALAVIGSHLGTLLQLLLDDTYLQYLLLLVLPVVAFIMLHKRTLSEEPGDIPEKKRCLIVWAASLVIGAYDGFYGPGTGTLLLLIYCNFAKLDVRSASGTVKCVNSASNVSAMLTSLLSGKAFVALGLIGAVASLTGNYLGSGLAIKNGSKIVRPVIILVLILLTVKVATSLFGA